MVWILAGLDGSGYTSQTATVTTVCSQATTTSATTAYSSWLGQQTATSSGLGGIVWVDDDMDHQAYFALARQRAAISHEHRAQIAARARAQEQYYAQLRRDLEAADRCAHELLLAHLTEVQRATFRSNNWFVVEGGKTETRYRIHGHHYAGNIHVLAGDPFNERVTHRLCCHCAGDIPLGDQLLTQKLCLQYDEENFLRTANRQSP
jgi:hypothetical protein